MSLNAFRVAFRNLNNLYIFSKDTSTYPHLRSGDFSPC